MADRELEEEVRHHLELRAEQLERQGMTTEAARAEARRRFDAGEAGRRHLRRAARRRDERLRWRDYPSALTGDARYAVRVLARHPIYGVGVAGTLGLGLAAAVVTFSIAWRVWLAPMPYPDAERVVRLYEISPPEAGPMPAADGAESRRHQLSPTLITDLTGRDWRTIEAISGVNSGAHGQANWTRPNGETQRIPIGALSPEGFGILGVVPVLGRFPAGDSDELVVTEEFWRSDLGGDPEVIGSTLRFGTEAFALVGVARLAAGFPRNADVVMAPNWDTENNEALRSLRFLDAVAKVRPGYSVEQAEAELNSYLAGLAEIHPVHAGWRIEVSVLSDDLIRPFRGVLALLLAAGTLFLLLATANVLGLVGARRVESRHDRSIRLALGASEGRLLRSSLLESLLLSGMAAAVGISAASWLIGPIRTLVPQDVPRLADVAITPQILGFGVGAALAVGVVVGLLGHLVSRGARLSSGRAHGRLGATVGGRRALVIAQIAVTTVLTAAGAAILERVSTLRATDLGYEPEGVSATSSLGGLSWDQMRSVLDGLRARGISAAVSYNTPLTAEELPPFGARPTPDADDVFFEFHPVSADYFSVLGVELLAGRVFSPADEASEANVVVVSEEFVERFFPTGTLPDEVVGRQLAVDPTNPAAAPILIGVVESTLHQGPSAPVTPDVYTTYATWNIPPPTLLLRDDPDGVAAALRDVLERVVPGTNWTPVIPFTSHLRDWYASLRLQIVMVGTLAALGLLLACLGIYSLMASQVATRRKELGIRKAVGAADDRLMLEVLGGSATMALIGAAIGLAVWYQLLPWTRELVDGIDVAGAVVPATVVAVIGASTLIATLAPAIRAARVDPAVTLRVD